MRGGRAARVVVLASVLGITSLGAGVQTRAAARGAEVACAQDARGADRKPSVEPQRRVEKSHTTVELIAAGEQPGIDGVLWTGLHFTLEPGWHIYWRNPGDSGGPPAVRWTLPSGVNAGDIEWPAPERIPFGSLVNYGYSGDVTLPVPVRSARGRSISGKLRADVKWLACRDICVPGSGTLAMDLPLPATERSATTVWRRTIDAARARVPKRAPAAWRAEAAATRDRFVLTIALDRVAPKEATFFPLNASQVNDSAPQQVTATGRTLRIELRASDQMTAIPERLDGVLAFGQQAWQVGIEVQTGNRE